MAITASIAEITLRGIAPVSFSRLHAAPKLEGESHDDYDARTWPEKMTLSRSTGEVVYPAFGFHQMLVAAAKYSGDKIPGQGAKTWGAKFERGVVLFDDPSFGVKPEDVTSIRLSVNADGIRGSGKRVFRTFPIINDWELTATVNIVDQIITQPVFEKYLGLAGLFIGLGRFRPQNGGTNGRFVVKSLNWEDNRKLAA